MADINWKTTAIVVGLFYLGNGLKIAYDDQAKVKADNSRLQVDASQATAICSQRVRDKSDELTGTIQELRTENSGQASALKILQEQTRTQQNTINGFGSQIIKATVQPRKITPLVLENDDSNAIRKHIKILVLTNQPITPVIMTVICDVKVFSGSGEILGAGFLSGGVGTLATNALQVNYSAPAWTPESPIVLTVDYSGQKVPQCSFSPH